MRCLIVDMALGYGAVYELRDLPKAVRRKFIPMPAGNPVTFA